MLCGPIGLVCQIELFASICALVFPHFMCYRECLQLAFIVALDFTKISANLGRLVKAPTKTSNKCFRNKAFYVVDKKVDINSS